MIFQSVSDSYENKFPTCIKIHGRVFCNEVWNSKCKFEFETEKSKPRASLQWFHIHRLGNNLSFSGSRLGNQSVLETALPLKYFKFGLNILCVDTVLSYPCTPLVVRTEI